MIQIKRLSILSMFAALAATGAACHKEAARPTDGTDTRRRMEVRIDAPATRTALGDDGAACWVKGDRLALWAYGADAPAFEQVPFRFWYRKESPDKGMFVGMVDPMAAGTYTYYGAYPLPETAAGTKVTYTIPSVQNGAWNGQLDIMLAATQGAELQEEILNEVTLRFHHKVHVLKITVPQGRNRLGSPIERLHIEFPHPVTGRMTWDLTAPEAAPEMAATSNAVTLEFAEPIDEGDTFWVYLAPADLRGGEVRFTATDGTEFSWPLTTAGFDDCRAGVITPVNLTVAEARPQADFRIAIDPSHLGETVTQIDSLTMPAGYEFPALGRCRTLKTFIKNSDGTFTARIFNDQTFANGMQVGLGTASENTEGVYGKRCDVRDVTAAGCTIAAPYLFFEDFSEITSFNVDVDKGVGAAYAQSLADYNLEQWYAARAQGEAGQAIRIRCNSNGFVYYPARIDSRPLSGIRPGRQVNVQVTFNANANGEKAGDCRCNVGTSSGGGGFKGSDELPNGIATLTIAERSSASFAGDIIDEYAFTAPGCTNGTCLSWQYVKKNGSTWISGYTSMWMDNVRVTIVQ